MARYAPSGVDPLAEALNALRSGYSGAVHGRRQRDREDMLDQERQEDRQFGRDRATRQDELTDLGLAERGIRRGAAPTRTVEVSDDDTIMSAIRATREAGRAAFMPQMETPAPLQTGAFKPGVGFQLPTFAPAEQLAARNRGVATREETDPQYRQLTDGYYLDESQTPEARARTERNRERSELEEALAALRHVGADGARAIARGAPAGLAVPDTYGGFRSRDEYFADVEEGHRIGARFREPSGYRPTTREQWLADQREMAELRGTGGGITATSVYTQQARLAHTFLDQLNRLDADLRNRVISQPAHEAAARALRERYGFETAQDALFAIRRAEAAERFGGSGSDPAMSGEVSEDSIEPGVRKLLSDWDEQNPNASPEEMEAFVELLRQRGLIR